MLNTCRAFKTNANTDNRTNGDQAKPGQVKGIARRKNKGNNQKAYQAHLSPLRKLVRDIAIVRIPNPIEIIPNHQKLPAMYFTVSLSKVRKSQ
jgi:hypothetical protein